MKLFKSIVILTIYNKGGVEMKALIEWITSFFYKGQKGATAVEYALIVALIAVVIIVAVTALGGGIQAAFENITAAIAPAAAP